MAHFRESNAVHLEILEQAIATGVPIEVDIYDGANPGTMLEHLEGAAGVKFSLTMNEEGAGEFRLSRGDPKATPEIIDREHLAKVKIGGVYRFSFWMENRKIVTLTENEEAGEFWHVSGREGVYAYIDRATMDRISRIGDDPIEGVWDLTAAGTGNKLGQMLRRVLDESLAKSPSPLEFLSLSFDYVSDSLGNTWATDADVQVNVGTHLLPIAKMLSALGMDLRGRHDLRLSAYEELGRHLEADGGTGEVIFRAGQNVTTSLERTSEPGIRSRMLVKGTGDEFFEVLRPDLEADPYIRRREGFLSFGNSDDPTTIQRAAEAELAALASRRAAISFGADHDRDRGGYMPFVDYDLGDWTTLDEPGVFDMETVRIVGITIEQEEDDFRVILDANSIVLEELLKVARRVQNGGGGGGGGGASTSSVGGGGGGGGSITSPAKVAVEAGDTPGFLYGKLQAGAGIGLSLAGPAGNRKVEIAGPAAGVEDGYAPLDSGLLVPASYLGTGAADGTKFLRGDRVWAAPPGASPNFLYSTKVAAAMDDEFTGPALDPKWAVTAGVAAAVNLHEVGNVARYDLATRPGWMLIQVGSAATQQVKLRQDAAIPDGGCIVAAIAVGMHLDAAVANDELQIGISLNADNADYNSGARSLVLYATEADAAAAGVGPDVQSISAGHTAGGAGFTIPAAYMNALGRVLFLRIIRSGLWYTPMVSLDGTAWINFGSHLYSAAMDNLWIFARNLAATGTIVPINAIAWIRQGSGLAYDPWAWAA